MAARILGKLSRKTLARWQRRPDTGSSVYAISAGGQFIKFGNAKNPSKRLDELQVGSPFQLKLLGFVPTPDIATAVRLEKLVHKALVRFYVRGEWFQSCPRTLAAAEFMKQGIESFELIMIEWLRVEIDDLKKRHASPVRSASNAVIHI